MDASVVGYNDEDVQALNDFDLLLVSVLPHKFFQQYLENEKPEQQPYLSIIRIFKLYQAYQDDLADAQRALQSCETEASERGSELPNRQKNRFSGMSEY